jgi:tripartite-type tricarboxylate transporter receptor subunit TctC
MNWRIYSSIFVFIVSAAPGPTYAQSNYPSRNISLLFGFPAGSDIGVRIVAEGLAEGLGKPVIVENVPGAAGNIAADRTAHAVPDGYTIGMLTGTNIVIRPLLYSGAPSDPLKTLTPVSLAYRFPNVLVVNKDFDATTLSELVEMARVAPGAFTFGHLGTGSVTHLSGELLKARAKIDIRDVPYRGAATLFADMMASRIAMAFVPPSFGLPMVRSGKLRALAVTSRTRVPFASDIPTVAESGYSSFEMSVWFGLFVPAGTPQPIVDRLNQEVVRVMRHADVEKRFIELGLVPVGSSQSEFDEAIAEEALLWTKLVKDAGIKPIN